MFRQLSSRCVRRGAAIVALLAAACDGGANIISGDELYALLQSDSARPLVLDVRTEREFRAGHVPGAVNIAHSQLQARLAEVGPAGSGGVVVYCEVGRRARYAASILRQAGYENVQHLAGDMAGWRRAGLPVAR